MKQSTRDHRNLIDGYEFASGPNATRDRAGHPRIRANSCPFVSNSCRVPFPVVRRTKTSVIFEEINTYPSESDLIPPQKKFPASASRFQSQQSRYRSRNPLSFN